MPQTTATATLPFDRGAVSAFDLSGRVHIPDAAGHAILDEPLALDRATFRRDDKDGHLHVAQSNMSRAMVNDYVGHEIPFWKELGLDANKIYALLRDPVELEKSAASFSGKPLLFNHRPIHANDHAHAMTVGAVLDAWYEHPYLKGKLSIWDGDAIRAIEDGSQKELSAGYHYRPDMTPGVFEGKAYDGIMKSIEANHMALVPVGRAGRTVVVGDSADALLAHAAAKAVSELSDMQLATLILAQDATAHDPHSGQFTSGSGGSPAASASKQKIGVAALKEKLEGMSHEKLTASLKNPQVDPAIKKHIEKELDSRADRGTMKGHREAHDSKGSVAMAKDSMSRAAVRTQDMLFGHYRPKIAQDKKLDLGPILKGLTDKNFAAFKGPMVLALQSGLKGKIAQDEDAEIADVPALIDAIEDAVVEEINEQNGGTPAEPDPAEDDADMAAFKAMLKDKGLADDMVDEICAAVAKMMPEAAGSVAPTTIVGDAALRRPAPKGDAGKGADTISRAEATRMAQDARREGERKAGEGKIDKPAMDAAITAAVTAERTRQTDLRKAYDFVRPWCGELPGLACDSAEQVHRAALDHLKIAHKGVDASALATIIGMAPKPGDAPRPAARAAIAQDAAGKAQSYDEMFPNNGRLAN